MRDTFEVDIKETDILIREADELSRILAKSVVTLKQNDNKKKLSSS
jgi:hypothetical protein